MRMSARFTLCLPSVCVDEFFDKTTKLGIRLSFLTHCVSGPSHACDS